MRFARKLTWPRAHTKIYREKEIQSEIFQFFFYASSSYDEGPSMSTEHQTAAVFPLSPKHQNTGTTVQSNAEMTNKNDFGPIPISPHVNVPNTHAYNHHHHVAPPLPPRRRERKESDAVHLAQIRQAPDAPKLPPRDVSPPPLPPRLGLIHTTIKKTNASNTFNDEGLLEHNLKLPHTSTIMMRRNSALERACASKDGQQQPTPDFSTSVAKSFENNSIKSFRQNVTSAPPINRKTSTNVSPTYSPGETTPRLPPKPRNPNFSSHNGKN